MTEIVNIESLENTPHSDVFEAKEPRTIRLKLEKGEKIPPHTHKDKNIVIYIIEGKIELSLNDKNHQLKKGEAIRFDGEKKVSPKAIKDSVALIILASKTN